MINIFFLYICLFFPLFWNSICQIFSPLLEILSKFFFCSKKNQVVTTNSSHQFFCLFSLWFNVKAKVENEINDHYLYTLIIVIMTITTKEKNNREICVFNIRLSNQSINNNFSTLWLFCFVFCDRQTSKIHI